jgi:ABC-type multidrug transport system ATPase subunit
MEETKDDVVFIAHHLHRAFKRTGAKMTKKLQGTVHQAVQSVNFAIKKGEIFGLAGHNGAGKSTTLNIITGAIK